jgi:hypothetical protein
MFAEIFPAYTIVMERKMKKTHHYYSDLEGAL